MKILFLSTILFFQILGLYAQSIENKPVYSPDNGNGTYTNPVLYADYSDPDAIRVGDYYYLVSSSFNCVPALPILQSTDLVNWQIVANVFTHQKPSTFFEKPQHGNGVWAPSIRFHNNKFYIYYGDPDFGIYMTTASQVTGPWTEPLLVKEAKGWIDPCPFWDDNGDCYLVHAFAGSRAGIKSILMLNKMNKEGTQVTDNGVLIFDGHKEHSTVEGPKMYKRNGYYYVFAPAGGVPTGWQVAMRSKNIYGPYEYKIVLSQGNTEINGPHQGAWVDAPNGESWFLHFQDKEAYGRIVHLQPMTWKDNWPVIGQVLPGSEIGQPVSTYKKPFSKKESAKMVPASSDEFNSSETGLQWQWHANPISAWGFASAGMGFFRLNAIPLPADFTNFWDVPNLFLQKFPAEEFTATAKIYFDARFPAEKCGLIIMGEDYSYISVTAQEGGALSLSQTTCLNASKKTPETTNQAKPITQNEFYLRVCVSKGAKCKFFFSTDNEKFEQIGDEFVAKPGRWIGAKVGLFCVRNGFKNDAGYINVDWFRIN